MSPSCYPKIQVAVREDGGGDANFELLPESRFGLSPRLAIAVMSPIAKGGTHPIRRVAGYAMEIDEPRYAMRAAGSGCVRPGWFWVGPQLPKLPRNKDHHFTNSIGKRAI
jgi:hypothetical protein